jgi:hypothetical protein
LLTLRGVRFAILAPVVLTLAACNIGSLGDGQTSQDKSPGTVTLQLNLPSSQSFCDQLQACAFFLDHISLATVAGQSLQFNAGFCPVMCSSQCSGVACPAIACPIGGGQAVTQVQMNWDGSYYESSTCGQGTSCYNRRFVLPGRYVAHMCATPGTLAQGDVGPATCTPTAPQECVDVTFDLPGPPLVEASLPDNGIQ